MNSEFKRVIIPNFACSIIIFIITSMTVCNWANITNLVIFQMHFFRFANMVEALNRGNTFILGIDYPVIVIEYFFQGIKFRHLLAAVKYRVGIDRIRDGIGKIDVLDQSFIHQLLPREGGDPRSSCHRRACCKHCNIRQYDCKDKKQNGHSLF